MTPLAWKEGLYEETYEKHVDSIINYWREIFKKSYLNSLSRILDLDTEHTKNVVEIAIILHDVGKLFIGYQEALKNRVSDIRREYRHEIVSAAITFFILPPEDILYITSGAILLHHEPILMGQIISHAEPYLTITDVERRLRKICGNYGNWIEFDRNGIIWTCKKLQEYPFNKYIPEKVEVDNILEKIKELILSLCIKCSFERKAILRLKVSSFATLLSILDSVAANESRGSSDDGGTFITRRSRKAEVSLAWL